MDTGGLRIETRPSLAAVATATAEEESVKRNTDCVYFLASPLTCKKGNECEYRHSEAARLNPRDCWYWLNSQCLNLKCAFRHPPLDGLLGTPGSSSTPGTALPPSLAVPPKQTPMAITPAHSLNKQSVRCIFFQKGHCLKGDKCPFSHGPQATGSSIVPQPISKASPSLPEQPNVFTKDNQGIKQYNTNHQSAPKLSVGNSSGTPVPPAIPSNGLSLTKNPFPPPRSQPAAHASVVKNNAWSRAHDHRQNHHSDEQHLQNGLEPGEIVEEHSSSGFDAPLPVNTRGSGSYHKGDDFSKMSSHTRKKPDPPIYRSNQYSGGSVNGFEQHGRAQDYNDMRPRRASSERSLARPALPEKSVLQRHKSSDEVYNNKADDLRNRLKQRRLGDGSRSAVSHRDNTSYRDEKYQSHQSHHSRREQVRVPLECSISARLRGRISLPRTSPEKERRDMVRNQGRLSPTKPNSSIPANGRNFGGRLTSREEVDSLNFSGPKSLAELKGAKVADNSHEQSTKNTSEPEGSPSFEGPKPLSILIKRKREEKASIDGAANSSNGDDSNQSNGISEQPSKEDNHTVADFESHRVELVEEEDDLNYEGRSSAKDENLGDEDYMDLDEAMDEEELQKSEQGDGDEAAETGDFKIKGESREEEEEEEEDDDELDDDDDFARKVGLIYS